MNVFKVTRKLPDGSHKRSSKWYGKVRSGGHWKMAPLYSDKAASVHRLQELQRIADQKATGMITVATEAAGKALVDHITDRLADMQRQGCSPKHVYTMRTMLNRVLALTGWKNLSDMTADNTAKLLDLLKEDGLNAQTINRYIAHLKGLIHWCQRRGRLGHDPLVSIQKLQETPRQRAGLTREQINRLLESASPDRTAVYRFAALTGLRRSELRALQWDDIHLETSVPFIQLRAETTKNRKADQLPLHSDLVIALKSRMPGHKEQPVFPHIPGMKAFRSDLRSAGLDEKIDFHCLRHTYCQLLVRAGVSLKMAQQLMRHSDPRLTSNIYGRLGILDTAQAIQEINLIGTADRNENPETPLGPPEPRNHRRNHGTCFSGHIGTSVRTSSGGDPLESEDQETIENAGVCAINHSGALKAGDGIRTHDVQLGKLAFYR